MEIQVIGKVCEKKNNNKTIEMCKIELELKKIVNTTKLSLICVLRYVFVSEHMMNFQNFMNLISKT